MTDPLVPARAALEHAERVNGEAGHENLGFLSAAHGFLPREQPRLALPEAFRAWDEVAAALPGLWRDVAVREALDELPVLDAEDLPEPDLWRASCILSILAHSYVRVESRPHDDLPAGIRLPWQTVAHRLGRPQAYMSYNDLIVYNWRLGDPASPDPMRVENLDLLVPTVGNEEERIFYLVQVEIAAQCAPLVAAAVRAQEAVTRDDAEALATELLLVLERVSHVTEVSFQKIDPNPLSATHVDPVVWANTVAPLAVPLDATAGPSGTAAPTFHLLDCLLGRRSFGSRLGQEASHLRGWFPQLHLEFLDAVDRVSVRDYVTERGDRALRGLFSTLLDAYAGPRGYLGVHRLKVYGYLELAFKIGREITIGGFAGAFKERAWEEVDDELENSRLERYIDLSSQITHGVVVARDPLGDGDDAGARRIEIDIAGSGAGYRPGDRCAVLPENSPELVERTLSALRAEGSERVPLTNTWRTALRGRPGVDATTTELPLADFLRWAKLRPLLREVGDALVAVTASEGLDDVLETREEDQWELPDAIELVTQEGYNPRRLWRAQLWQAEAIARIVPPEGPRSYSISSAPDATPFPSQLDLTVGPLAYRSSGGAVEGATRRGAASTYLVERADGAVPLELQRPARFRLPDDPSAPVVMFAAGTGIGPFRGFLQSRAGGPGENWLFFGTRTRRELYYGAELERLVEEGSLRLRVAFSREDVDGRARSRLPGLLEEEANAAELWRLLAGGAYVYVCGSGAFAQGVWEALERIVSERLGSATKGRGLMRRLVAERRFMQDVFTTFAPHTAPGPLGAGLYGASDVALHNDDEHGHWLVIDGIVHDVTEFLHLHPGGPRIMRETVGRDATHEFRAVGHYSSSEIVAMLPMFRIGRIRRLDFGTEWGIALAPGEGLVYVTLRDLFRAWVRYLHLVVEMENALRNDLDILRGALTRADDPRALTPLKVQYAARTHTRFLHGYLGGALGEELARLFALTVGLCAPAERVDRLAREVGAIAQSADGRAVRKHAEAAQSLYLSVSGREREPAAAWDSAERFCNLIEHHDGRFLAELKHAVRAGVQAFEELEAATVAEGGERLVAALRSVPALAADYYARVAAAIAR